MTLASAWESTRPFRVAVVLLALAAMAVRAQDSTASTSCDGKTIREIRVSALRPPFKGQVAYWRLLARSIGLHHATTDTVIIRRFLALETGGECSDFRMRESARLLREQPFLTDVSVKSVPVDPRGVRIDVQTTDEISVLAAASFGHGHVSYLEIGNENMFGEAWLLAIHGANRELEGRSAGFRMTDYQFLKKPYQLDVAGDWGQHAASWLVGASHAYLTDLQRIAWEVGVGRTNPELVALGRGEDLDALALQFRSFGADIGGVVKLGNFKTPILIGGVVTAVRREIIGGLAVTDSGLVSDTTLRGRYPKVSRARFGGIAAWRNLNFVAVNGFNALTATEDVPTGFQLFTQLGRGTHSLAGASDIYTLGDVLAGVGSGKSYSELHLITEGRREIGRPSWDGIVSSGLLAIYLKPTETNLLRAWTAFATRTRTPSRSATSGRTGFRKSVSNVKCPSVCGISMKPPINESTARITNGIVISFPGI